MRPRILIIDDDPDVLEVFIMMLEKDYDVTGEGNISRLLDGHLTGPFDLIVIDHRLNEMTSSEIIPLFRRVPAMADTPVLIYSGDNQIREIALAAGATGFIPKPSSIDTIRKNIAWALGGLTG